MRSLSFPLFSGLPARPLYLTAILLMVILVSSSQAIVKQQQQHRSDDQPQQQQSASSSSFNHQASLVPSSQSASANSAQQQQQVSNSNQQQLTSSGSSYGSYNQAPVGVSAKSSPDYADSSEHSYQAAAQSVNMALVNSGIFGPSNYQSASSQLASGASSSPSTGSNQNQASLNPVHYFYYPSKDSSQAVSQQQSTNGQQVAKDMLTSSSNGQSSYPSIASVYPSYTDQYNSPLSGISASPDVAASSQDPSYLPQPMVGGLSDNQYNSASMQGSPQGPNAANDPMASYSSSQQTQQLHPQQQQQHQQQQQQQQQHQQQQQQSMGQQQSSQQQMQQSIHPVGGSISFKGQTSAQNAQNDYLNSHINHQQSLAYQSLYNQLNDLSTSNFGSPAASLASYLSSPSGPGLGNQQREPHSDLFSSSALSQSFSPAASHLSPASVSPPVQASQYGNLFGAQQSSQPLFSAPTAGASNPAHYLNPYLSGPFGQLAGSQVDSSMLSAAASAPSASSMAAPSSSVTGSGKRFGIGSFIMPVLALAGLSLLIPTMSNIGTAVGRKKRSIAEEASDAASRTGEIVYEPLNGASQGAKELSIGEYLDKLERYYSIYQRALENEDCLNRIICEFGVAVKDVSGKSAALSVIEKLVPSWMTGKMHLFKEAALDKRSDAADKCRKHVCTSNRQHF